MAKITRAIISVSNKKGVVEFARELHSMGVEILSTGGTAKTLRDGGIPVKDVSEHTGFPEMLDGRVKTLHPKIHGGLLSRRKNPKDMEEIKKHGIVPIDMVVVNLYPFEETISKPDVTFEDAIENIDIGGPTMIRSAAKNFQDVAVVVDPSDYETIIREMKDLNGELPYKRKLELAQKVFSHTSRYDTLITNYLARVIKESV
jgi:phosphoribosylaminoimidazolecarboxamide formyltransferase / IMP cyclohydrolase